MSEVKAGSQQLGSYPFQTEIGVRHTDLDVQKCVNNVALADIFEDARTQYSVGRKLKGAFDPNRRVIDSMTIRFGEDGCYPGSLSVHAGVATITQQSWTLRLVATQKDRTIATNDCTFKLLDGEGAAVALPPQLVQILERDRLTES